MPQHSLKDDDDAADVEVFEDAGGWHYAFGSEGYARNADPVGPFDTEAEALDAARDALQDELNEAAYARGFDADGREVA